MRAFTLLTVLSITFLFLFSLNTEAIDISATGSWDEIIDETDLIAGAGSDLVSSYESNTNATRISISGTTGKTDNWRVDVKRSDINWHGDFILYVKRTSDGGGPGSISGGLNYSDITTSDREFFSGAGKKNNIKIQYRLTGMSVDIGPALYSTTIIYTVVDTP